ncbi:hypothetical protein BB558_001332 [Smittium angustum]|uniref:Uncharacterized protein n=1 Tax=Smittium angustum TaxID=133377 RepID=A0A2U1JBQ9_SMIAN|nr:hypothetical protein BB558_003926 [Smittium angustum]PWA02541.1 hypothetical protein BB558_001332 [Smittium angustum]
MPENNHFLGLAEHNLPASFRAAAAAVTHLYKVANESAGSSYKAGYEDCLMDLLSFFDFQNEQLIRLNTKHFNNTHETNPEKTPFIYTDNNSYSLPRDGNRENQFQAFSDPSGKKWLCESTLELFVSSVMKRAQIDVSEITTRYANAALLEQREKIVLPYATINFVNAENTNNKLTLPQSHNDIRNRTQINQKETKNTINKQPYLRDLEFDNLNLRNPNHDPLSPANYNSEDKSQGNLETKSNLCARESSDIEVHDMSQKLTGNMDGIDEADAGQNFNGNIPNTFAFNVSQQLRQPQKLQTMNNQNINRLVDQAVDSEGIEPTINTKRNIFETEYLQFINGSGNNTTGNNNICSPNFIRDTRKTNTSQNESNPNIDNNGITNNNQNNDRKLLNGNSQEGIFGRHNWSLQEYEPPFKKFHKQEEMDVND